MSQPPRSTGTGALGSAPGGSREPVSTARDRGGELMLRWQGGDDSAFTEIVDLYSGQVFALLTRFLGRSHPGREDMVQDVFLRVLKSRDRYEPSAKFSTWLYSIALRMSINETERSYGRGAVSLDERGPDGGRAMDPEDVDAANPEDSMAAGDRVRAVRSAIAELPESQRVALVLSRYHGLPYAEIADVVGSSEKAIKSLIHRARETLRETLRPLVQLELQSGEDGTR